MAGPNPEIMRRWVTALRSGEYTQGRSALRREYPSGRVEHCCLGVLTDLAIKDGAPGAVSWEPPSRGMRIALLGGIEFGMLPLWVQTWAGLDDECPAFDVPDHDHDSGEACLAEQGAAELNDSGVWSFNDIATLIEEQLMPPSDGKEEAA